jgi:hypothetical protein
MSEPRDTRQGLSDRDRRCVQPWRNGIGACSNRLTIRAKIVDAHLLEGHRAELLRTTDGEIHLDDVLANPLATAASQFVSLV